MKQTIRKKISDIWIKFVIDKKITVMFDYDKKPYKYEFPRYKYKLSVIEGLFDKLIKSLGTKKVKIKYGVATITKYPSRTSIKIKVDGQEFVVTSDKLDEKELIAELISIMDKEYVPSS
jgi:hypothetical protein